LKVLIVYKDYYPVLGGIENHVRLLAEGLQERGAEVLVLVTNTSGRCARERINHIPVIKAGRLLNISSAPVSHGLYLQLRKLSRWADIIHMHAPYPPAELWMIFSRSRIPFLLSYHSDIVRQKVLGSLYRPFLRLLLRKADAITVSSSNYIATSPHLPRFARKCEVIHLGVDLKRFSLTPETERKAVEKRQQYGEKKLILFVGRLRYYKGIGVLIDAMKLIENGHALIAGSGPMGTIWRKKAVKEGITDRITFLGRVSEEELHTLYHASDIFVFPSINRAEAFGLAQVEAMACGLPVICTELGTGTSFVNQHEITGIVVPPGDARALASALQRLIDGPSLRKRMGDAGYRRAHSLLSKREMIDSFLELYGELILKKR
jgi:glycosyltransferase involved in cell wall biosynthesis